MQGVWKRNSILHIKWQEPENTVSGSFRLSEFYNCYTNDEQAVSLQENEMQGK